MKKSFSAKLNMPLLKFTGLLFFLATPAAAFALSGSSTSATDNETLPNLQDQINFSVPVTSTTQANVNAGSTTDDQNRSTTEVTNNNGVTSVKINGQEVPVPQSSTNTIVNSDGSSNNSKTEITVQNNSTSSHNNDSFTSVEINNQSYSSSSNQSNNGNDPVEQRRESQR